MVETLGLTAFTVGHSANIASKSSDVSVFMLPEPPRVPNERMLPLQTSSLLVPIDAISSCACFCAPAPRLTMAMTAPTPMMMPNIVRIERILFRFSAFNAIFKMTQKLMMNSLKPTLAPSSISCLLRRDRRLHLVAQQMAVFHVQNARGIGRNVMFMRHHHQRDAFLTVQVLQESHDLFRSCAVQVACGLVG